MREVAHSFPFEEGWPTDISEPAELFLRSWIKVRNGRLIPKRTDVEPLYFLRLLPMVWMYEYKKEEDDFLCHLHGEVIREAWGCTLRNRLLGEFAPKDYAEKLRKQWKRVLETPALMHSVVPRPTTETRAAERICLPLQDENGKAAFVLGMTLYADLEGEPGGLDPRGEISRYYTIRLDPGS